MFRLLNPALLGIYKSIYMQVTLVVIAVKARKRKEKNYQLMIILYHLLLNMKISFAYIFLGILIIA